MNNRKMIQLNVGRFCFAKRALACDSRVEVVVRSIRWYAIIVGISVVDLSIEAIIREIVVNYTA